MHDQYEDEVDAASDTRRDDTRRDGMPAKVRLYLGSFKDPLREMIRSDSRAIVLYIYVYWLRGSAVCVRCNAVFRSICMLRCSICLTFIHTACQHSSMAHTSVCSAGFKSAHMQHSRV